MEQPQVLSNDGNCTAHNSVDNINLISSQACLPFRYKNSIRNGTHTHKTIFMTMSGVGKNQETHTNLITPHAKGWGQFPQKIFSESCEIK